MVSQQYRLGVTFTAFVFAAGVLVGSVYTGLQLNGRMVSATDRNSHLAGLLGDKLRLTERQRCQVLAVVDEMGRHHSDLRSFVRSIRSEAIGRIRATLNEQQRARFDALVQNSFRRREETR